MQHYLVSKFVLFEKISVSDNDFSFVSKFICKTDPQTNYIHRQSLIATYMSNMHCSFFNVRTSRFCQITNSKNFARPNQRYGSVSVIAPTSVVHDFTNQLLYTNFLTRSKYSIPLRVFNSSTDNHSIFCDVTSSDDFNNTFVKKT